MRIEFDTIVIDASKRELVRDDAVATVEPMVFDLIMYLIENRDRVVSKDELVARIWDGRAISDSTLSSCVKAARRALGDSGHAQRFIKTFHRRGFRFVGPLETDRKAKLPGPSDMLQSTVISEAEGIDLSLPKRPSIAVLPFSTHEKEGSIQHLLAGGLVDDLTVRLARTRWLFVTARASAERFRIQTTDAEQIGRALGVRYLLHGSVIRSADRFRLTVALCDAGEGSEIWAERFDREIDDLFTVQDAICDCVVAAVESEIELKERQKALLRPLASLDAWSAYHRANDYLYRFSPEAHEQAEQLFHLAARADPASSRIYAGLSFLHWQRAFFETTEDRDGEIVRATEFGQHSVSLDRRDPQAHWVLGRTALLSGDLDLAIDEMTAAVDLNPNHAKGHFTLGYSRMFRAVDPGVLDSAARARRISPYDPMSFAYLSLFAEARALMGDHEEALVWAKRAARQPNAHYHIQAVAAWCHEASGDRDGALSYAAEIRKRRPDYSRAEFFRAYPYEEPQRAVIDDAFKRLGF